MWYIIETGKPLDLKDAEAFRSAYDAKMKALMLKESFERDFTVLKVKKIWDTGEEQKKRDMKAFADHLSKEINKILG